MSKPVNGAPGTFRSELARAWRESGEWSLGKAVLGGSEQKGGRSLRLSGNQLAHRTLSCTSKRYFPCSQCSHRADGGEAPSSASGVDSASGVQEALLMGFLPPLICAYSTAAEGLKGEEWTLLP